MTDGAGGGNTGLPGTAGIPGSTAGSASILSQYGINTSGLALGSFSTASTKAMPTDMINVGSRAAPHIRLEGMGWQRSKGNITYDQAQNLPSLWYNDDPNFYKQFVAKAILYRLPGASSDMGLPEVGAAWDNLLQTAIQLNKANPNGKQWTPWDVLETYNHPAGSMGTRKEGDWLIDVATGDKVKYIGPKYRTTKQTTIDMSNPEQVQAIATQVLTQMIGRAPTDKELAQFKATLNGYEKEHPDVATTTDTYDDMGNVVASNVVHSGGVDQASREAVLSKGVKGTKEYGKYQSGTTYFNALLQMVGGG